MTTAFLDIESALTPGLPVLAAKAGRLALTPLAQASIAVLIVVLRVFLFEYFHGDRQPLHTLYWMIANLPNA